MDDIVSLTLTLLLTPLSSFSPFSWWPLIFHFLVASHFSMTSLLWHRHLQQVCLFPPPLFHSTFFIQCWSLCNLHVAPAIFSQLFSFLCFAIFLRDHYDVAFNPISILDRFKLSLTHAMKNNLGVLRHVVDLLGRTKESGKRNPNNPHIKVMLQYFRKYPGHSKFK